MIFRPIQKTNLVGLLTDRFFIYATVGAVILNSLLWLIFFWYIRDFPEQIPLHYNIYFGIDLVGPWYEIFKLSGFGTAVVFINTILALCIHRFSRLLTRLLVGGNAVIQILLFLAGTAIVRLTL
ncbi:MAG: hypothetical protein A2840_00050 [Candidatus Buchananbacteria bacterium RIFCSPHIGHO2_01_FULL_47_11b]|uniref:DUF1648 domain-containing protein n=1 Tax=Candidatus Buchananbacteria bacterium RIFCSPHIGHO2_01_FULL_47_11b TaxID=1797537 RepID=A0A1G1Y5P4_9BACT|nr:MAG: hypothetical protein A2840_00050 [Candidatus Buchananbacteria bacterium RIFCSPHIGHO2_01_FULL_47_11b]